MQKIRFLGDEIGELFKILNANAFPDALEQDVHACADKLGLMFYSFRLIEEEINKDLNRFIRELHFSYAWNVFVFDPEKHKDIMLTYHSMKFQAGLQSFFISMKSMLDMYAQIISKLIKPDSSLFGFNKGGFKGKRLVGGTLLNWIERTAPTPYLNREQIITLLVNHIKRWIAKAVGYRDQIVHYEYCWFKRDAGTLIEDATTNP